MFILEELFCDLDDFCTSFEPRPRQSLQVGKPAQRAASQWRSQLISQGLKTRRRKRQMSLSEIMTILVAFHQSYYRTLVSRYNGSQTRNAPTRNFKRYYLDHVCVYWLAEFPKLPSYQRFVEWMPSTLLPLCVYLKHCFGKCTGISFIDSTCIKVCHMRSGIL